MNSFVEQFVNQLPADVKRRSALDLAASQPLPDIRHDEWKYTNLSVLGREKFTVMTNGLPAMKDDGIHFLNGVQVFKPMPAGVKVISGAQALSHPAVNQGMTRNDAELFLRLNEAFAAPIILEVEAGKQVEEVIRVAWRLDSGVAGQAVFPRLLVLVGKGAKISVIETYQTVSAGKVFVNNVTDLHVADAASLDFAQAFVNNGDAFQISSARVQLGRDSRLRSFQYANGSRLLRNNLSVVLNGEGGDAVINGLHELSGTAHADSHTYVEHKAPNTLSRQLYKSILDGESRSVFNGKILVQRDAQLTNSYQLNKNLILSPAARVDTKPQLEIFADDVKCSHGATIGQLNDEELFYFASRGIDRKTATRMMVRGFIDDVVGQIESVPLRDALMKVMNDRV